MVLRQRRSFKAVDAAAKPVDLHVVLVIFNFAMLSLCKRIIKGNIKGRVHSNQTITSS